MKPKLSDYLIILASLIAIFLAGAAVGYVVGEKRARPPAPLAPGAPGHGAGSDWEARTLERLRTELALDEAQCGQVSEEIRETFLAIRGSKDQALKDYYRELLDLHDRILPHLDDTQKARLTRDREQLRRVMEERFGKP